MFKWPMLAAAALATALQPAEVEAQQEIETVSAIHFDAGEFVM